MLLRLIGSVTLAILMMAECGLADKHGYVGYVPQNSRYPSHTKPKKPISAQAEIRGVGEWTNQIRGRLYFQELAVGGPVVVRGTIDGLTPGLHGLHIHEHGNLTDDCKAAGPHFNPFAKDHGDPAAGANGERHVGDLGNIEALDMTYPITSPRALVYLIDEAISLSPTSERGILNRAVVVHQDLDDLGRTDHEDSKKTGNAGQRVACGLITVKP